MTNLNLHSTIANSLHSQSLSMHPVNLVYYVLCITVFVSPSHGGGGWGGVG